MGNLGNDNKQHRKEYSGVEDGKYLAIRKNAPIVTEDDDYFIKEIGDYSRLYDSMTMAQMPINQQRVGSVAIGHSVNTGAIRLMKALDPDIWGKMIARLAGAKFAGAFGGSSMTRARDVKVPKGFTQREYVEYLINNIPDKIIQARIWAKIKKSKNIWKSGTSGIKKSMLPVLKEVYADKIADGTIEILDYDAYNNPGIQAVRINDILEWREEYQDFWFLPHYMRFAVCVLKQDFKFTSLSYGNSLMEVIIDGYINNNFSKAMKDKMTNKDNKEE